MSAVRGWPRSFFSKLLTESFFLYKLVFLIAVCSRETVTWIARDQHAGERDWCAGESSTAAFPQAELMSSICSVAVAAGTDGP